MTSMAGTVCPAPRTISLEGVAAGTTVEVPDEVATTAGTTVEVPDDVARTAGATVDVPDDVATVVELEGAGASARWTVFPDGADDAVTVTRGGLGGVTTILAEGGAGAVKTTLAEGGVGALRMPRA